MHVFGNFVLKRSHHMLSLASIMKTFICALLIRSGHHLTVLQLTSSYWVLLSK